MLENQNSANRNSAVLQNLSDFEWYYKIVSADILTISSRMNTTSREVVFFTTKCSETSSVEPVDLRTEKSD